MTTTTTTTTMTAEQMLALIAKLQADNAALAAAKPARSITMKVGEKGGLSVYGLGRFPVSLYRSQWERLLAPDTVKAIHDFIKANEALLTVKA